MLVAGIVIRDFPHSTPARGKVLKSEGSGPSLADVRAVQTAYSNIDSAAAEEIRQRQNAVIAAYVDSAAYKTELLELLKPQLKETLFQVHDYRQLVTQILQNVNVLLEKQFPHVPLETKLDRAPHELLAIYWAATLMEEKLRTMIFLREPEKLDDTRDDVAFRLHGAVLKYLRIYQRAFEAKGIKVEMSGTSYGEIVANPTAVGVIPQTLLDNALKYSPRNAPVKILFEETDDVLTFTVGSYGPRIRTDEEKRIFELFFRGEFAQRMETEGSGYGLYLAQLIASKNGAKIRVKQDAKDRRADCFWTEFTVIFRRHGGRS